MTSPNESAILSPDRNEVDLYLTHLSEVKTVSGLFSVVGDEVRNRWQVLGETDSKVHWAYGAECDALISEGAKSGLVYKAIAIAAGKDSQTIRKAFYTFKAYTFEQREKYHAAPYSVFQQARTQEDPIAVLEHYVNKQASVDEIMAVYPEVVDKEFDEYFKSKGYPRIFYGIERELWGVSEIWKQEADEHLKALREIIEKVNS